MTVAVCYHQHFNIKAMKFQKLKELGYDHTQVFFITWIPHVILCMVTTIWLGNSTGNLMHILTLFTLTIRLISVNFKFPYSMCLLTSCDFVKIKIGHILSHFIMQFGHCFVKIYSIEFSGYMVFLAMYSYRL